MKKFSLILVITLAFAAQVAHAELHVFACEPEWAALTKELADDKVDVFAAGCACLRHGFW